MDQLIRKISDQLYSKLSEAENFYRIGNLGEYGFPPFIIRRIQIELTWNLDETMELPETDWANTESDSVKSSWQQFLYAIHTEAQLPASHGRAVIETAVSDVVEMLVQPRKNIPEILFGGEDTLSVKQLAERTELLVVYPHFANVLNSYMQRKNHTKLQQSRCKEIISTVDAKVTRQYSPLQWAQMLDPLFIITEKPIGTDIFRLFFEDKDQLRIARKFDLMEGEVTRAEFIEVLSSPDLLNYEGYEEEQSALFAAEEEEDKVSKSAALDEEDMDESPNASPQDPEEHDTSPEEETSAEAEDNAESGQDKIEVAPNESTDSAEEVEEDHLPSEMPNNEKQEGSKQESASLNDTYVSEEKEEVELEEEPEPEKITESIEPDAEPQQDEKKGIISPIWQRFMSAGEVEDDESSLEEEHEINVENDASDSGNNGEESVEKENLKQLLADEKDYYIEELFNGSEEAYEKSLHEISSEDNWKSASKRIEEDIFKRNEVEIYSDPALNFIDRLHTYFLDKKNHN